MHDENLRVRVDARVRVAVTQRKARQPAKTRIPIEAAAREVAERESSALFNLRRR
jgi:hypothetical protein